MRRLWAWDVTTRKWVEASYYVYDDTPVNGVTFHRYYCKGPCVPLATTWTNAEGNWVDAETGKPLVPNQNVQVNSGVMIQVNQ